VIFASLIMKYKDKRFPVFAAIIEGCTIVKEIQAKTEFSPISIILVLKKLAESGYITLEKVTVEGHNVDQYKITLISTTCPCCGQLLRLQEK
jgi:hypothetical protein